MVHYDPITAPPPAEVPLTNAPLVRVLAQVRFPKSLAVENREVVARFQDAVAEAYPVLREEQAQGIVIDKGGAQPGKAETIWRFSDVPGEWKLSLAPSFLALETTRYRSRSDFLARLEPAVAALVAHFDPKVLDRFGLRYLDRITGAAVEDLRAMVRPELCGLVGTDAGRHATHALTEAMFGVDGTQLRARWALLPPHATHDPQALAPIDEVSWILDLDMFRAGPAPFDARSVTADAQHFAERIYTFFRWAVTDTFLARYGGTP